MSASTMFDIREVPVSHPANFLLSSYAFAPSPQQQADEDKKYDQYYADSKLFMSFEGETALAKVSLLPMTMNVRGNVMPMGGIGGVATMPAGRRSGRVRALMNRVFEQMREDGQPVSALYPFRESFYERLGYSSLPCPLYLKINPAELAPLMRLEHTATIDHTYIADGFDAWTEFLQEFQSTCHGFSLQGPTLRASIRDRNKWWLTLVREDGKVTGAMTYLITGEHKPMHVKTLLATTVAARYRLLEWIGRHTDQVPTVQIPVLPGELSELWWNDLRDNIATTGEDAWGAPMARIVSLDALSGISAGDGEVTIAVTDDHAPWNTGVWTLRGSEGVLEVTQGGTPNAMLTIQGLSALLFNGTDPEVMRFRGWGDVDAATSARLLALFPPRLPFINEQF
jgi:predicted acetyltransferase